MIYAGDLFDVLPTLPAQSVHCVVTSPPYWGLRDYGVPGQLGLEPTPEAFVERMVAAFREVRRVLRDDGTLWLNIGDSYAQGGSGGYGPASTLQGYTSENTKHRQAYDSAIPRKAPPGYKPKDLVGVPWLLAFALRADGWYLRAEIIWAKGVSFCDAYAGSVMPESVQDRPTRSHEQVFLLTKNAKYFYDAEAVREQSIHAGEVKTSGPNTLSLRSATGIGKKPSGNAGKSVTVTPFRNLRTVWAIGTKPFTEWGETVREVRVSLDDVDDDTTRITSPDCPVHGDRVARVATAADDGREGDPASCTPRIDASPAPARGADSVPIGLRHEQGSAAESSDSSRQSHTATATPHSSQSRKTAPAPSTTAPCSVSAQTNTRTGDTSARHVAADSVERMPANSTAADSVSGERETFDDGIPNHNGDKCSCEYYRTVTEKTSHFATFPPDLVVPCIKAGTSEKGVCAVCGAPWRRLVEKEPIPDDVRADFEAARQRSAEDHGRDDGFTTRRPNFQRGRGPTTWEPTCACGAAVVPATVMDCFSGAGTVGAVCAGLHRRYVGIELNAEYIQIAERRIAAVAPLFTESVEDAG